MQVPAPSSRALPDRPRTVGTPAHWAAQGALFGALVTWITPIAISVALYGAWPWATILGMLAPLLVATGVAAAVGAAVGSVQPALLDAVRGRLPLAFVAVGQGLVGAGVGWLAGWVMATAYQLLVFAGAVDLAPLVGMIGAFVGGISTLVAWLPVTVATVLRTPAWPVTTAAALSVPSGIAFAMWLLLVL